MPIKPENKARYPKEWKAIRARLQTPELFQEDQS